MRQPLNVNSGQPRTAILNWGRYWSCRPFVGCSWPCWTVDELTNLEYFVDIADFFLQNLSAVFATKNLLELCGDENENLNFMNFKIDNFKIHKNSWLLGNLKIRNIRILNLWLGSRRRRRRVRGAEGIEKERYGEGCPIRLGGLGSVVSSPAGSGRPRTFLVHFEAKKAT